MRYWWILLLIPSLIVLFSVNLAHAKPVDTTKAVIHHTATAKTTSVECIRRYHMEERGWNDIGYHYLIDWKGNIFKGRPLSMKGAHALNPKPSRNHYVGIALIGFDEFTEAQEDSLTDLIQELGIIHIEPHHSQCPGPGMSGIYK